MLGPIRKFSTSFYAKILLVIIIIPFVFWGMGSSLSGGNKNVIVIIDKDKIYAQEFINFAERNTLPDQIVNEALIENLFSNFVGEKLIEKEIESFDISLSNKSLSKLIKHQKAFKRENEFSRVEYEKFLLENNINAGVFETNLTKQEKKKQLLDFVGAGIFPANFLVNMTYNKINQKRKIEIVNLNDIFNNDLNVTDKEIESFFKNNKDSFQKIYKSFNFLELNTKKITGANEYDDLYFKKIDEIDDAIAEGKKLDEISEIFNLGKSNFLIFDESGEDKNSNKILLLEDDLIKKVYNIKEFEPVVLAEHKGKYFIFELLKTEIDQKKIDDLDVKKQITKILKKKSKRKLAAEFIGKINEGKFQKLEFDNLIKEKNISSKKITIKNLNDKEAIKIDIIKQVYSFPEKSIIVVNDINFDEIYLIYIEKVDSVSIEKNSDDYKKYSDLFRKQTTNRLYKSYDYYIKNKYKIDVNYKTFENAKNYFIY
tara:strand:- start:3881 stop:5332 length:1452 start_codon:yes stop_codon:yes gene_type:complete